MGGGKQRAGWCAVVAFLVVTPLLLVNTGGRALHNGDEAIYAEMAREMADGGRFSELRWQGAVLFPRPPMSVWIVAGAHKLFGDERAVRWPLAAAAGAEVALVLLLGCALYSLGVGLAAAGTLLTFDLFVGYARYFESEPMLCAFVLAALVCWERARKQPRYIYGWGVFLGCALMTKQVVGALPLLTIAVDRLGAEAPRIPGRTILRGILCALVVWLPWHVLMLARHGGAFVDGYLVANVLERGRGVMLHTTRWNYYARELWRSEGVYGLVAVAGVLACAFSAMRRRTRADLLIATWALGVLGLFSLSASRFDYYALLAYPALALATGALVIEAPRPSPSPGGARKGERLRAAAWLRGALVLVLVGGAGWQHLRRDLSVFDGDEEVRTLARLADARLPDAATIYLYNTHPYSARYYTRLPVVTLLESAEDLRLAGAQKRSGLPISVAYAPDLTKDLAVRPGPFALLIPRARASLLAGTALLPMGESRHYLLYGSATSSSSPSSNP